MATGFSPQLIIVCHGRARVHPDACVWRLFPSSSRLTMFFFPVRGDTVTKALLPLDLSIFVRFFFSDDLSAILFFPLGNRPVCQLSTVTPAFVVDCTDQFQTGFPNEQLCIPSRFLPVFRLGIRAVSLTGMVLISPLFMYQPSLS